MSRVRTSTSLVVTLIVGLATLFALALTEGAGGRDSVVRLTRGRAQRIECADTASHDHGDPEASLSPASDLVPGSGHVGGAPLVAALAVAPRLPAPLWHRAAVLGAEGARPHAPPPGHAVSGRAPPAL